MKARLFQYLPLCVFLLAACGPTVSRSPADAITFDTLKGLDDFEFATAGERDVVTLTDRVVQRELQRAQPGVPGPQ